MGGLSRRAACWAASPLYGRIRLSQGLSRNGNQESAGRGAHKSTARRSRCPDRGLDPQGTDPPPSARVSGVAPAAERPAHTRRSGPARGPSFPRPSGFSGSARVTGCSALSPVGFRLSLKENPDFPPPPQQGPWSAGPRLGSQAQALCSSRPACPREPAVRAAAAAEASRESQAPPGIPGHSGQPRDRGLEWGPPTVAPRSPSSTSAPVSPQPAQKPGASSGQGLLTNRTDPTGPPPPSLGQPHPAHSAHSGTSPTPFPAGWH